jgi:hypothetical protein|tara:strand:+ start:675 stop:1157 length:483 start_codon:yes stop_codon:yes gene_type:complete
MEEIKSMLDSANLFIKRADHMFYVTYPLVKDSKLIITMAENINRGLLCAVDAILMYEKLYKRISIYPEDYMVKMDMFKDSIARRYNIDREHIVLIQDMKKFLDERKKSGVEFVKDDKYVLFNQKREVKSLGIDKLKQNLNMSKDFLRKVNGILSNVTTRF